MKKSRIFWGFIVLGAGILLLLGALGIGEQFGLLRIVATLLLLGIAIESLFHLHFLLFFLPVAISAYLWRVQIGLPGIHLVLLLVAAVLLGISFHILFRRRSIRGFSYHGPDRWTRGEETLTADESVAIDVSFGEQVKHLQGEQLRRVRISSSFAKTTAVFEQIQLPPQGLQIEIDANFSEVVLSIPRGWTVDSNLNVFAAAVNGLPGQAVSGTGNVHLSGSVHFGEVRIQYI